MENYNYQKPGVYTSICDSAALNLFSKNKAKATYKNELEFIPVTSAHFYTEYKVYNPTLKKLEAWRSITKNGKVNSWKVIERRSQVAC